MKLGAWMFGMPDWSAEEIASRTSALGYEGVSLRVSRRDGLQVLAEDLRVDSTDAQIETIRTTFADAGVEIRSFLNSIPSPLSGTAEAWERFESELLLAAELAGRAGVPAIMFQAVGPPPGGSWDAYLSEIWRVTARVLDSVPGVGAMIENHMSQASAKDLLATAQREGDPRIGVEFSPDHSIVAQENVLEIVDNYTPWIQAVCFADRRVVDDVELRGGARHPLDRSFDGRYYYVTFEACWFGDGLVPAREMFTRLERNGFDGYVSLKWEKSAIFGHHLPPGEEALEAFPAFMQQFGVLGNSVR
jgi:sugar phosphate isomerase/epimerase